MMGLPHPNMDPISSTASKQGPATVLLIVLFLDYQSVWFRVLSVGTAEIYPMASYPVPFGLPRGNKFTCQGKRCELDVWIGKIP